MKTAVPFSPARVLVIAQHTLREAGRQRLFPCLGLLAGGMVAGAKWLRDFNFGAPELKFLADCGFGAMAFFGAVLVIAGTAQLFLGEIEHRTVLTVLARPVWRAEFVLGKFLGVAAMTAVFCALLTLLLGGVLALRERELAAEFPDALAGGGGLHYPSVFVAGAMQWLKLTVLGAMVLLVASFAQTQLFTVVAGFFLLVIGHLQYLAQDAHAQAGWAFGRVAATGVTWIFPNFQLFGLADSLVAADAPPWMQVARVAAYGLIYIAAACALAVFSFRQREL